MLKACGKITACHSKANMKQEMQFYVNLLSTDGKSLMQVKVKPENYATYAGMVESEVDMDVTLFSTAIIYMNEAK